MKALNMYGVGDIRFEEVPMPEPAADEALLKVLAVGICGSDVPRMFSKGVKRYPMIIGHEFAGEIVAVGDSVDPRLAGRRAAVFPLLPCFKCPPCLEKDYASCRDYDYYGSRRDGAFAEYIAVKEWNLVPLPDNVPTMAAAMMEPCAVAVHSIGKSGLKRGDTVCVFGAGAIGLILARIAYLQGAKNVMVLDVDETKLEFTRGLGFKHAYNSRGGEYLDALLSITEGKGADICFDAAGVPAAVVGCFNAARPSGTVVLMGNPSGDMPFSQDDYWTILRKQLTLKGTWNSSYGGYAGNDWDKALKYISSGKLDLCGLITHTFPLEDADKAFALTRDNSGFYVKVMFLPQGKEPVR